MLKHISDEVRLCTFNNGDSEATSSPKDRKRTSMHLSTSTRYLQTTLHRIYHSTFLIHHLTSLASIWFAMSASTFLHSLSSNEAY
jgi:hypothetical protein